MVNEALVLPAGTVMVAGTLAAAGVLLFKDTDNPPVGAAPVSVTVPCETIPPGTLAGLIDIELTTGGVTVRLADLVVP